MSAATEQLWRWKKAVIVAALAIIAAAVACLLATLRRNPPGAPMAASGEHLTPYKIEWVDASPPALPGGAAVPARPVTRAAPAQDLSAPAVVVETGESAWEQHIAAVLADEARADSMKAQALLALLPLLPEELLQETTQAAADRLRDEDYAATALPLVLNPQTHGMTAGVLFVDLMERPDALTLPALLAIARIPDHPFGPAARSNLELLLEQDFADDWTQWEAEVQRRLSTPQN